MIIIRGFFAALFMAVFVWCLAVLSIFHFGRRDEARPVDAIVVLGAAQYDGKPSPVLKARLDHAIELYQDGMAEHLIMTGGVGVGDTVSEAEVSRRYAVRNGIEEEKILIERSGLSSGESMDAVVQIMQENNLSESLLVSDPFHMLRLRLIAARLGLDARSSPTFESPIALGSTEEWRHVLRESLILPSLLLGDRIPAFITGIPTDL
jgi:uncharacterized SAM-binding protein YcdF (DUF218 family)